MKKNFSITVLLCCFQFVYAQSFTEAGLDWSKNCQTNKPTIKRTVTYIPIESAYGYPVISQQAIEATLEYIIATVGLDPATEVIKIVIPNGSWLVKDEVFIPSNVILAGNGSTSIVIDYNVNAGLVINNRTKVGIENLTINNYTQNECCFTSGHHFSIKITNSSNCWVKGIESYYGGTAGHIEISGGEKNEISGCYIHDSHCFGDNGGGRAYGIQIVNSIKNLIVHNKLKTLRHHILLSGKAQHNVIAYNKISDTHAYNFLGCSITGSWPGTVFGQIDFHGAEGGPEGPGFNLIEGNCIDGDMRYGFESGKGNNKGGDTFKCLSGNLVFQGTLPIIYPTFGNCGESLYYGSKPNWWPSSSFPTGLDCQEVLGVDCPLTSATNVQPIVISLQSTEGEYVYYYDYMSSSIKLCNTVFGTVNVAVSGGTPPYNTKISLLGSSYEETLNGNPYGVCCLSTQGTYIVNVIDAVGQRFSASVFVPFFNGYIEECLNSSAAPIINENTKQPELKINEIQQKKYTKSLNQSGLIAYPNPVIDKMNISYKIESSDVISLLLVNSIGQTVQVLENNVAKSAGDYVVPFDRGNLASGVYQGILINRNGKSVCKVIIQ